MDELHPAAAGAPRRLRPQDVVRAIRVAVKKHEPRLALEGIEYANKTPGRYLPYSQVRITGKVTRKYRSKDGEYCVDIETQAMNQRGEDAMPGTATVALPSKNDPEDKWPVSRRLN